jgi:hypothetical protein
MRGRKGCVLEKKFVKEQMAFFSRESRGCVIHRPNKTNILSAKSLVVSCGNVEYLVVGIKIVSFFWFYLLLLYFLSSGIYGVIFLFCEIKVFRVIGLVDGLLCFRQWP